ncbi:hypothetical protein C3L33_17537, partial [Rhododendron williamsianum]
MDSSQKLTAYAYVWANINDPNLYGDWHFEEEKGESLRVTHLPTRFVIRSVEPGMKYCSPFPAPPSIVLAISDLFSLVLFHVFHSIRFVSFLFGLIFSSSFFTFSISYKEWRLAHMKDFINMTTGLWKNWSYRNQNQESKLTKLSSSRVVTLPPFLDVIILRLLCF